MLIKNERPFRFWCQKVLPLVYDDSLSYYELLCKVVGYINELIEQDKVLVDDIDKVKIKISEIEKRLSVMDEQWIADNVLEYLMQLGLSGVTGMGSDLAFKMLARYKFDTTGGNAPYQGITWNGENFVCCGAISGQAQKIMFLNEEFTEVRRISVAIPEAKVMQDVCYYNGYYYFAPGPMEGELYIVKADTSFNLVNIVNTGITNHTSGIFSIKFNRGVCYGAYYETTSKINIISIDIENGGSQLIRSISLPPTNSGSASWSWAQGILVQDEYTYIVYNRPNVLLKIKNESGGAMEYISVAEGDGLHPIGEIEQIIEHNGKIYMYTNCNNGNNSCYWYGQVFETNLNGNFVTNYETRTTNFNLPNFSINLNGDNKLPMGTSWTSFEEANIDINYMATQGIYRDIIEVSIASGNSYETDEFITFKGLNLYFKCPNGVKIKRIELFGGKYTLTLLKGDRILAREADVSLDYTTFTTGTFYNSAIHMLGKCWFTNLMYDGTTIDGDGLQSDNFNADNVSVTRYSTIHGKMCTNLSDGTGVSPFLKLKPGLASNFGCLITLVGRRSDNNDRPYGVFSIGSGSVNSLYGGGSAVYKLLVNSGGTIFNVSVNFNGANNTITVESNSVDGLSINWDAVYTEVN